MAKGIAIPAEFAAFWAAYPRRPGDARYPASVAFAQLVKAGESAEALVASAGVFAAHCRRESIAGQFIPMGRTWLSQRRFEDFQASASDSAPRPESPAADPRLAWLSDEIGRDTFGSWIAPLRVEDRLGRLTIIARTQLALDRVRRSWGERITARLGAVDWVIERSQP